MIMKLEKENNRVWQHFTEGHHAVWRSEKQWAGLSTDLVIEQTLMRSVKSSGGLTRGRGMSELQRNLWILSMPACAEMNTAMQDVTETKQACSEQHQDLGKSHIAQDNQDINFLIDFLEQRNSFDDTDKTLKNVVTGAVETPM